VIAYEVGRCHRLQRRGDGRGTLEVRRHAGTQARRHMFAVNQDGGLWDEMMAFCGVFGQAGASLFAIRCVFLVFWVQGRGLRLWPASWLWWWEVVGRALSVAFCWPRLVVPNPSHSSVPDLTHPRLPLRLLFLSMPKRLTCSLSHIPGTTLCIAPAAETLVSFSCKLIHVCASKCSRL